MRHERLTECPAMPVALQRRGSVRRRQVLYIPGYDPSPARRYRELYRKEGAAQAALSGYRLDQRPGGAGGVWQVSGGFDGETVETAFAVLDWSDLVRASMVRRVGSTAVQLARTAWAYLRTGALWRLALLRKGPMLAVMYAVSMIVLQGVVTVLAGWAIGAAVASALPTGVGGAVGLIAAAAGALLLLRRFRRLNRRLHVRALLHNFAFFARGGGAFPAILEERMAQFRATVATALDEDHDEVLVVAHSAGAQIAVSVLADLVRGGPLPARPVLGLLTLGQVIPMQSFLPRAGRLRADLRDLSQRRDLTWVDVSAPGDGCCFALCDPVAVSGVAAPGQTGPLVISAAFSRTLRRDTWAGLRWRFHRLHYQYLCAFDKLAGNAGDYDYFRITAGPLTLAARFAGRAPSRSRIDVPVSGHTGTAWETGA